MLKIIEKSAVNNHDNTLIGKLQHYRTCNRFRLVLKFGLHDRAVRLFIYVSGHCVGFTFDSVNRDIYTYGVSKQDSRCILHRKNRKYIYIKLTVYPARFLCVSVVLY